MKVKIFIIYYIIVREKKFDSGMFISADSKISKLYDENNIFGVSSHSKKDFTNFSEIINEVNSKNKIDLEDDKIKSGSGKIQNFSDVSMNM